MDFVGTSESSALAVLVSDTTRYYKVEEFFIDDSDSGKFEDDRLLF